MMSLWLRMQRVLGAEAHAAVDKAEKPLPMLSQLQRELVEAAGEARLAEGRAGAWQAQLRQRLNRLNADTEQANAAARTALERDNEDMARAAIERRRARQAEADAVTKQLEQASALVNRLSQRREQLGKDLTCLRDKRVALEQRSRFARSVREFDSPLGTPEPISEVVARMEDKVQREEAQAEYVFDLAGTPPDNALDDFIHDQSIDAELAELRASLSNPLDNSDANKEAAA